MSARWRPMEKLSDFTRLRTFQFHHNGAATRACLNAGWELQVWAGPLPGNSLCPAACSLHNCQCVLFPKAPVGSSCWRHRMTVTNSESSRCCRHLGDAPIILSVAWGGPVSFSAPSFSITSCPERWASCHSSRRSLFFPKDCAETFRLTWSEQAKINWAEYLMILLVGKSSFTAC